MSYTTDDLELIKKKVTKLLKDKAKLLEVCKEAVKLLTRINTIGNRGRQTKKKMECAISEAEEK